MDRVEGERLVGLEWSLWRPETRFDRAHLERVLAPEFREFGRSGRVYDRQETIESAPRDFEADLVDITVSFVDDAVALVTYRSVYSAGDGLVEHADRASLWRRPSDPPRQWLLFFHQGTPTTAP